MKLLASFLALTVCIFAATADPIGHLPYLVSIQIIDTDYGNIHMHRCAGALISPYWVVSSATCVYKPRNRPPFLQYAIVAGTVTIDGLDNRQEIYVDNKHQYPHPDSDRYNLTTPYDIALFQVDTPFTLNEYVQPLRLPKKGEVPKGNAVLSGWGANSNSSRSTTVSLLDYTDCKEALEIIAEGDSKFLSSDSNICSGPLDGSTGSCFYDRGSPLVQDDVLIGFATWGADDLGLECGTTNLPSVYTEISAYIDFIEQYAVDITWAASMCEKHAEF